MGVDRRIDITADHKKALLALLKRHLPNTTAWVYGSRAKWTSRPQSDLDLVVFTTPDQERQVSELREAFEESNLPFRVDLFVWDTVPEQFRKQIEVEHVVLVKREGRSFEKILLGAPGNWLEATIDDIIASSRNAIVGGPFGSNLVSRDYVPEGVPVIRGQNMGNRWVAGDFVFVTQQKAKSLEANLVRPGDIVLTQRGTLGQVSLVPLAPFDRYLVSQSQMKITVNREIADPLFFYYVLSSVEQQDYVRQNAIQTGVPHTNLGILRSTPVPVPSLDEQRAIAHVLGTLDDKIELNRRMNETLEAMARALFKSWFIDFDPVRAKMAGRDPGLPEHLANLFPDRLVDSELGPIPEGWEVSTIGQEVDVVGGSTPSTKDAVFWNGTINWATPKDLSSLESPVLVETSRKITEKGLDKISSGLLPRGTVLLSSRAPIGYLAISDVPVAINQGFIAMKCQKRLSNTYVWLWTAANMAAILENANGSTFQEISKSNFRPLRVIVPNVSVKKTYNKLMQRLYDRIVKNERQSRSLANLRDILLPKLISGKLRTSHVSMGIIQ